MLEFTHESKKLKVNNRQVKYNDENYLMPKNELLHLRINSGVGNKHHCLNILNAPVHTCLSKFGNGNFFKIICEPRSIDNLSHFPKFEALDRNK